MMSQLEEFLASQVEEGIHDSSGLFTLDSNRALEKMAAFQLPRSTAWILKVVQAAVSAGASWLSIDQTTTDTVIRFDGGADWKIRELEVHLCDPEVCPVRALDHLKRGLWHVGIHGGRPFQIRPPGKAQSLVWTGARFHVLDGPSETAFQLVVSHRSLQQGKGFPLIRELEASHHNHLVTEELADRAFTCPLATTINGIRLDALPRCPHHGHGQRSYPFALVGASGGGPLLPIPPATFGKFSRRPHSHPRLSQLLQLEPQQLSDASAVVLLSLHCSRERSGDEVSTEWRPCLETSHWNWVQDGVIVSRRTLPWSATNLSVSCGVFASAAGIPTDLTGLAPRDVPELFDRQAQLRQALTPQLEQCQIPLTAWVNQARLRDRGIGGAILVGSLGLLAFSTPAVAGMGCAYGLYHFFSAAAKEKSLDQRFQEDLKRLKRFWATG